jgi:hypothetical protein
VIRRSTDAKERLAGKVQLRGQRIGRPLSEREAQEIAQNLIEFFRTLLEWKAATLEEHRVGRRGVANALPGAAPAQKFESCLGPSLDVATADHIGWSSILKPQHMGPSPNRELAPLSGRSSNSSLSSVP